MTAGECFRDAHLRRGARDMLLSFGPGVGAWGIVTGVAMTQSGLGPWLSALMSLVVYSGGAQLVALPLIAAGAPIWVTLASALCINVRFAIFSAQWRVHFGHLPRRVRVVLGYFLADLNLIAFQKAWPSGRREPGQARYAAGSAAAGWLVWQTASLFGIAAASTIPLEWGLGFAGTLSMLGIAYSMLGDRASWLAATVAATAAVATFALPLKLNVLVAIAAAVAASAILARSQPKDREGAPGPA